MSSSLTSANSECSGKNPGNHLRSVKIIQSAAEDEVRNISIQELRNIVTRIARIQDHNETLRVDRTRPGFQ